MSLRDMVPWRRQGVARQADDPMRSFQQEMSRLFSGFWTDWPRMQLLSRLDERMGTFVPSIAVSDSKDSIQVTAELPGMDENDIDITLSASGDQLILRGEKKLEAEKKEQGFYHSERVYGAFQRAIPLPTAVDGDKVSATFQNGVLTIDLPKLPEARSGMRHIPIGRPMGRQVQ